MRITQRHRPEPEMTQSAIDLDHLARQTGGDHALERELLALFAQVLRDDAAA